MKNLKVTKKEEQYYLASQWQLMGRKFRRHKLAISGGIVLAFFYLLALFANFFATYDVHTRDTKFIYCPPQRIRFFDEGKFYLRPFVYGIKYHFDERTFQRMYAQNKSKKYSIRFFVHGDPYRFWNLFRTDLRFIGVEEGGKLYLFGTDKLGRDLFSRNIQAARISLSIGLVGVGLSFILGSILGGISGYFGGKTDMFIQRIIEFLLSIPTIPLWMALAAMLPKEWSVLKIYFFITIILAIRGWCGLARVVRGKILELREMDYVTAARLAGAPALGIILTHLLPSFISYLIVHLTLAIPFMILGETALSFLGLGMRPPAISWGVLLKDAQNAETISMFPWLLIPALFVIVTVLAFNALGDGLRDAADPYK